MWVRWGCNLSRYRGAERGVWSGRKCGRMVLALRVPVDLDLGVSGHDSGSEALSLSASHITLALDNLIASIS